MKIPEYKIDVEKSSNFSEDKFGIGNVGFILNILRDKLYSNIIESACREYASNGRDAHREIGTPTRPIEIHLPNAFESNYRIKDYGIGINPERMTQVFLQYGNSTKRNDNIQIGGFGIGAKIFFGYAQQFSIITICNEIKGGESINKKHTYIAFVDSSQEGRLNLVKEEITNEPTGTEIICAVEDKDIQAFIDGTLKSTHYWPTRPLLFGVNPIPEFVSTVGDLLASGENWKIYNTKTNNYYNRSKAESLAIIDGIQYSINRQFVNPDDQWILDCNVHLFFDIGQLTLSASRESLQYDENTKKLINKRIRAVQKELSEQIIDIIDKKESYIEAVEFHSFMSNYFYKVVNAKTFTWRGIKIIGPEVHISLDILNKIKANIAGYGKNKHYGKTSVKLNHDNKIVINKNTQYYYNDIDPTHTYRNKNLKALESHSYIQIINYIKDKTYDDFVADLKAESINYFSNPLNGGMKNYRGDVDNSFIFDVIKPIPLSSVIEDKTIPAPRVIKPKVPSKISVYRMALSSGWKLRDYFYETNVEADIEGCYLETVFKTNTITIKSKSGAKFSCSLTDLKEIKKFVGDINIYSVKEKDIPKFTKLKPLTEVLKEKFNELVTADYYNSMAMNKILHDYNNKHYNTFDSLEQLKKISAHKNKITDKKSLVLKYFDYIKYIENTTSLEFINRLEEFFNQTSNIKLPLKNSQLLLDEMKDRYKLLNHLYNNAKVEHVLDYINACDRNLIHK